MDPRPTCLVTGSASGVGRALSALLQRRGWDVIGVDLDEADIRADLASPSGRAEALAAVRSACGGVLHAAVTCAGIWAASTRCLSVNYFGTVELLSGVRPWLARSGQGRVVVVSSIAAIWENWPEVVQRCVEGDEAGALAAASALGRKSGEELSYRSSKAALLRWVRRAAASPEWAGSGVLVNAVAPGTVETPMNRHLWDSDQARAATLARVPTAIGRLLAPEEVAELLAFLASPANSVLVGQVLFADGGTEVLERAEASW